MHICTTLSGSLQPLPTEHAVRDKRGTGVQPLHIDAVHRPECPSDRAPPFPLDFEGPQPVAGSDHQIDLGLRAGTPEIEIARPAERCVPLRRFGNDPVLPQGPLSLIHISEPTRLRRISYAVFCL